MVLILNGCKQRKKIGKFQRIYRYLGEVDTFRTLMQAQFYVQLISHKPTIVLNHIHMSKRDFGTRVIHTLITYRQYSPDLFFGRSF